MEKHHWRWLLGFVALVIGLGLAALFAWHGGAGHTFWQFLASAVKIVVSIPLLFFLPGFFLLQTRAGGRLDIDSIERVMLMLLSSVGISAVVILFCVEAGFLRLWFVDIVLLLVASAIRAIGGRHRGPVPRPGISLLPLTLMLVLVVVGSVLFFTPHHWVTGDGDPGVNFNVASNIAKTGSVQIKDRGIAAMDASEQSLFVQGAPFIGLTVKNSATGTLDTRLYHMLPAWMAVFMKLFGVMGGLYVIPLFALFNILLLFVIGRRLAGSFGGFAAALLLAVSSIFIWFSRLPDSEVLLQFFLFGTLLVLVLYLEHKQKLYSLFLGILFGAALLTKVEALLYLAPLYLMFLVAMLAGKYDKRDKRMVAAVFAAALVALLYNWSFLPDTFLLLVRSSLKWSPSRNVIFLIIGILALVTLFFELDLVNRLLTRIGGAVRTLLNRTALRKVRWLRLIGGLAFFAWFIYLYAVPGKNPVFTNTSTNVLRLSWMTGGMFLLVVVAAFCVMLYSIDSRLAMLMLSVAVMTVFFFMLRYFGSGIVPWETRRYVTLFVPLLVLGVGFVAAELLHRKNWLAKGLAVGLVVLIIVSFIPVNRVILSNTQYAGAEESLTVAAQDAPSGTVVLAGKSLANIVGIPMRYRFGKDFVWLHPSPDMLSLFQTVAAQRQKEGRPLLMAGSYDDVYNMTPALELTNTGKTLLFSYLSLKCYNLMKPTFWGVGKYRLYYMNVNAGKPVPAVPGNTFTVDPSADPMHCMGYLAGFLYQEFQKGTAFWIKGSDSTAMEGLAKRDPQVINWLATGAGMSRVKIPITKSIHPIMVEVDISSEAKNTDLQVLGNGHPLAGSTTQIASKSFQYKYVLAPGDQVDGFQEIVLTAPLAPELGATASFPTSGLSFGRAQATVIGAP